MGFDFLGFQVIKNLPTKDRIFLHIMQCTITNNSFLLVFYSYALVFYPYVTGMYLVCTRRILLVCTSMHSYVTRMYSCSVLVTILRRSSSVGNTWSSQALSTRTRVIVKPGKYFRGYKNYRVHT